MLRPTGSPPSGCNALRHGSNREVDAGRIPGAVLLIARNGHVVYDEAVGFRDREAHKPMVKDAIFRIASMTKPFTTVAVMMLVEEGKIDLWDPVSKYLPAFDEQVVGMERKPAQRQMMVLDLLRHTSGLTYGANPTVARSDPVQQAYSEAKVGARDQTIEEFIDKLAKLPLMYQPGTHWEYSHSVDVLGRIVEVVSGQDLNSFVVERIAKPLGLSDTAFWAPASAAGRAAFPQVDPVTKRKQDVPAPTERPKWFSGGGGMVSTAADYARFSQMLLNGGALDGVRILSRKSIEQMTSNNLPPGVQYSPNIYKAFGGAGADAGGRPGLRSRLRSANEPGPQPGARQRGRLLLGRRLRNLFLGRPEGASGGDDDDAGSVRPAALPLRHAAAGVSGAAVAGPFIGSRARLIPSRVDGPVTRSGRALPLT